MRPAGHTPPSQRTSPALFSLTTDCQLSPHPKTRPKAFATPRHSPAVTPFLRRPHTNETPSQSMRRPHDPPLNAKAHTGIARRAGRSPSEARKLPEQKPRSPRGMSNVGKPQRGASGGMQGGPRRGRSPITGPALPCAAKASQLRRTAKLHARRAENSKSNHPRR